MLVYVERQRQCGTGCVHGKTETDSEAQIEGEKYYSQLFSNQICVKDKKRKLFFIAFEC